MKRLMMFLLLTSLVLTPIELSGQSYINSVAAVNGENKSAEALPTMFDLRFVDGTNYVTPIKHQTGGTCWAHGVMAAIEGNLMMDGSFNYLFEHFTPNMAEYHLDWWNGFNQYYNADLEPPTGDGLEVHYGGDYKVAAAYISRGDGPVREEDVPNSYDITPFRILPDYELFYTRDIQWYTIDDSLNGIDIIKNTIMTYGVLGTSLYITMEYLDDNFNFYQPSNDYNDPNHAVAIVGWDDTRITQHEEPGAWLCKNSWGSDWGLDGYFWISYYDQTCCRDCELGAVSFQNTELFQYDHIYYHDYHGWRANLEESTEAFNAFIAEDNHYMRSVSFYTAADNVAYTVKIYNDFINGELSGELITQEGEIEYKGFHTIDLDFPVPLVEGDDFYIYLYLSEGGHPFDRTSEISVLLGASNVQVIVNSTSNEGESFYREGNEWIDLKETPWPMNTGNFCIKALCAGTYTGVGNPEIPYEFGLQQNYPNPFNPSTTINYKINYQGHVSLKVYDVLGREIALLVDAEMNPGNYTTEFFAENLSSGIYIYQLEVKTETGKYFYDVKKMTLLK